MDTAAAITVLEELSETTGLGREPTSVEWVSKVSAVLRASFGAQSEHVREFTGQVQVKNEGYVVSGGSTRTHELWRQDAAQRGKAVVRAAIYSLQLLDDKPLDDASIDPELWVHVQGLIADDDWAKVPATVAIFLEHKVRIWADDPHDNKGGTLVGQALYGHALGGDGPLRLGRQAGERDGWRFLGVGLAQAVGNVDRHRIQQRDDVRRYAMGVLGLGSLLLTQLRYENAATVQEAEILEQADPAVDE